MQYFSETIVQLIKIMRSTVSWGRLRQLVGLLVIAVVLIVFDRFQYQGQFTRQLASSDLPPAAMSFEQQLSLLSAPLALMRCVWSGDIVAARLGLLV